MEDQKLFARYMACVIRNTLEELHSGVSPSSETGDYSDVKVISPYGEIPWNQLSRISDKEMRELMLDIEQKIFSTVSFWAKLKVELSSEKIREAVQNLPSWDRSDWQKTD